MYRYISFRLLALVLLFPLSNMVTAQSSYDANAPFGFATRNSRTDVSSTNSYNVTGGGCYLYPVTGVDASKVITLKATDSNHTSEIQKAIKNYSVIIFDKRCEC